MTIFPQKCKKYINDLRYSGIMHLSEIELKVLEQIAQGNTEINTIAKELHRDISRIYRTKETLSTKGFVDLTDGMLLPKKTTHVTILLQLLTKYPNIVDILPRSGISILSSLLTPKKVSEIERETQLKKSIIYRKIKQAIEISAVIKNENQQYVINEKIWIDLKRFLEEYKKFEETTDPRVPANSTIYYKNNKEILFSNNSTLDATQTGFSAYERYGLKLLLPTIYYYLPKKNLSKKDVFIHSLQITEKEKDIRHLTYVSLFYIKYKNELADVKHPILTNIKQILQGNYIKGYPSLEEIKEKADVYDIRL